MKIRYGTRGSKLALHQTRHVIGIARNTCPDIEFEEVVIKTLGDQVTGLPLFKVGGQGLFIKEIEQALLEHRIDMAVHSLKDVPHAISAGLCLVAVGCVEDARDCFLSKKYRSFSELPSGAIVGTSSLRRRSQLSVMRSESISTPPKTTTFTISQARSKTRKPAKTLIFSEVSCTCCAPPGC